MVNKISLSMMIVIVILLGACSSENEKSDRIETKVEVKKSDISKKTLGIKGMTCVGCEVTLEGKIKEIKGVVSVKASASKDNAVIEYDKTQTNETTINESIKALGYKPFKILEEK